MTRRRMIWDQGNAYERIYEDDEKLGKVMLGENKRRKKMRKRTKFDISRGDLSSLGYHLSKSSKSRHMALGKAVKKYGYKETMRKLTFLKGPAKLTKTAKAKVGADMNWLKKKYGGK